MHNTDFSYKFIIGHCYAFSGEINPIFALAIIIYLYFYAFIFRKQKQNNNNNNNFFNFFLRELFRNFIQARKNKQTSKEGRNLLSPYNTTYTWWN
jgi:hypothetical protein